MFFDIGWPELMLIGAVALVVIGPKDLPAALRVAGYWVRKARTLSREFHSSVEQMMREVELHEVQNELRKATQIDLDGSFNKIADPARTTAAAAPREVPDYLDTTAVQDIPELIEPLPAGAAEPQFVEPVPMDESGAATWHEPELPLPDLPLPAPAVQPEPAFVEPSKR